MDKHALREQVWDELEDSGAARFPFPPHGRIPNFDGAKEAAARLATTSEWKGADAIKANPDAPQLPVRRRALHEGKTVYMAVPRLRREACFMELDPARIADENLDAAATISSVEEYAEYVTPDGVEPVELIVSGSVAVTPDGARVGKGEGYSDLEYALLREASMVDASTTVATTVHEIQVTEGEVPLGPHDVPMDLIVTPERLIRTETSYDRPAGLIAEALDEDRIEEIPVLQRYR